MPRRLGSLAVALVSSVAIIVEPVAAAPPPEPIEGPVEGPAPPPSEEVPSEEVPSGEVPPPSIEFATPPPESNEPFVPPSPEREIGRAPDSGASFLAAGLWLMPVSAWTTTVLLLRNRQDQYRPATTAPGIVTAGVGLGLIGASMFTVGVVRRVKLDRWATRHRVIELPQGSGFLTSGTLALVIGLATLIGGETTTDLVVGSVMLASAPIQLGIGIPLAVRYRRTGGYRRTRYTLTPGGFVMQF